MSAEDYEAIKKASKDKFEQDKARFLEEAKGRDDYDKWKKCSKWHWQRRFGNTILNYWPSRKAWQVVESGVQGKRRRGLRALDDMIKSLEQGVSRDLSAKEEQFLERALLDSTEEILNDNQPASNERNYGDD